MPDGIKFSQLPVSPTLQGGELFPILQSGLNRTTTVEALTSVIGTYAINNTNLIHTLSANLLTEIQDNDTLIYALSTIGIGDHAELDAQILSLSASLSSTVEDINTNVSSQIEDLRTDMDSVSAGSGSPVFITSVNNTLGLEQLVYQADTVPSNHVVTEVTLDDDSSVEVEFEWDGPGTEWMGQAYINDAPIPISSITRIGNTRRFQATALIDLSGASEIEARVNNESTTVSVQTLGAGPAITNVTFSAPPTVGGYTPTYFLHGDSVDVTVEFDTNDVSSITLYSGGSFATQSITDFSISTTGSPASATFTAVIDNTSTTINNLPIKISAKNAFGTQGDEHTSAATIPCRLGPAITNMSFGPIPTVGGYQPTYFLDGDTVQVTVELDNANVNRIQAQGGASYTTVADNNISVTTASIPPSATFNTTIDTSNTTIQSLPARMRAYSSHNNSGNYFESSDQLPAKQGPGITNIAFGSPPTTGGYQPSFFLDEDDVQVVVELDNANVTRITGVGGGSVASKSENYTVTTAGIPPSATFTGTVDTASSTLVTQAGTYLARSGHNQDGTTTTSVDTITVKRGPDITNVSFGPYPGTQTELKDDDQVSMTVEYDTNAVQQTDVIGGGSKAGKSETLNVSVVNLSATMTLTIDTAVVVATSQSVDLQARGQSPNNQLGQTHTSVDTLTVNNVRPSFSGFSITYPNTQTALKQGDTADVVLTVNNQGATPTYTYSSPNSQLSIPDTTTYSTTKTVTCNAVGAVNESSNNYRLVVHRAENDTQATNNNLIYIADVTPVLSVDSLDTLRSGGTAGTSAQTYNITTRSDQYLSYFDMDNDVDAGSIGSWSNISQNKVWRSILTVNDAHDKGSHNWLSVTGTNRAGINATTITTRPTYTLGGFVERTVTIPSLSRTVSIGTNVHDATNLVAEETFRGTITFDATISDGTSLNASLDTGIDRANKFTIVSSSNPSVVDLNGDTFFYLDRTAAANNVSGTSELTIEETV